MKSEENIPQQEILDRFFRYIKIETTSYRKSTEIPSTPGQWELLNLLRSELESLKIKDISMDEHGYLIARLPSNIKGVSQPPVIGFIAHVDTSEDVSGKNVQPLLHQNYNGGKIVLKDKIELDPEEFPLLLKYKGETLITSDGTTLLGADNKAGIAEIMTAIHYLISHPEIEHGTVEIIFTPDEETGKGLDLFPLQQLTSVCCYTLDGDAEGTFEDECFHGEIATVTFHGNVIHPGSARGKLVNGISMASEYVNMIPRNESPEATDGKFGFYCPITIKGNIEEAQVEIIIRDFEFDLVNRRIEALKQMAKAIETIYPGGKVEVDIKKQYSNMRDFLLKDSRVVSFLERAIEMAGMSPKRKYIRGGTDGARLSEMGIPTPNVFTGGSNFHSKREWVALSVMVKSVWTMINTIKLWALER